MFDTSAFFSVVLIHELLTQAILALNVPTGIPLVYELDADLKPIKVRVQCVCFLVCECRVRCVCVCATTANRSPQHYYLGDPAEVEAAIARVAGQGKAKK